MYLLGWHVIILGLLGRRSYKLFISYSNARLSNANHMIDPAQMEESDDSIFSNFLKQYAQDDNTMDSLITKIKFVYRKPPSDDLCDKVQKLLNNSEVINYGGFKWVEPEWDSKVFKLLEEFLKEGVSVIIFAESG